MIERAMNYLAANSVQNYEFQHLRCYPKCDNDAQQEALDGIFLLLLRRNSQAGH